GGERAAVVLPEEAEHADGDLRLAAAAVLGTEAALVDGVGALGVGEGGGVVAAVHGGLGEGVLTLGDIQRVVALGGAQRVPRPLDLLLALVDAAEALVEEDAERAAGARGVGVRRAPGGEAEVERALVVAERVPGLADCDARDGAPAQ